MYRTDNRPEFSPLNDLMIIKQSSRQLRPVLDGQRMKFAWFVFKSRSEHLRPQLLPPSFLLSFDPRLPVRQNGQ